jgi:23S rRNA (adenine2030-N6)-methyltransferase
VNYRHRYHAGNFADVLKHAALLRLIAGLQAKEKGILYLDTHAGRGGYELAASAEGLSRPRAPEWPAGVGRLWTRADLPPVLADYVEAVRAFDREARVRTGVSAEAGEAGAGEAGESPVDGPRFYPGSPRLAQAKLRPQDRAALCEAQPEEAAALTEELAGARRASVQQMDGYTALRAMLPPPERRALVLIDPPFESQDEWARIVEALGEGLRRLPGGTFAVWYPLTARARVAAFYRELLALKGLPPCYTVELLIGGEEAGLKLWGCGLLVINPPWGSAGPLNEMASWLAPVLAQAPGSAGGVHWLVREN